MTPTGEMDRYDPDATLQGVDPASPKGYGRTGTASPDSGGRGQTLHPALACTMSRNDPDGARIPFARYESAGCRVRSVYAICGLGLCLAFVPAAFSDQPIFNDMPRWKNGWGFQFVREFREESDLMSGGDVVATGFSEEVDILHIEGVYTWEKSIRATAKLPLVLEAIRELPDGSGGKVTQHDEGVGDAAFALPLKQYFNLDGRSGSWTFAPQVRVPFARMSHKSSTARRNAGAGAGIVRCATLQGVDPASPAHPLETRTSAQPSFARYEFGGVSACGLGSETSGLSGDDPYEVYDRAWGTGISLGYDTETHRFVFATEIASWVFEGNEPFQASASIDVGVNFWLLETSGHIIWETDFIYEDDGLEKLLIGPHVYLKINDTVHAQVMYKKEVHSRRNAFDHGNGRVLKLGLAFVF